jgi:uncharacterized membrane protein (TIGR02234 family)
MGPRGHTEQEGCCHAALRGCRTGPAGGYALACLCLAALLAVVEMRLPGRYVIGGLLACWSALGAVMMADLAVSPENNNT